MRPSVTLCQIPSNVLRFTHMMRCVLVVLLGLAATRAMDAQIDSSTLAASNQTIGQNTSQGTVSSVDNSVPTPQPTGNLGQIDAAAASEVAKRDRRRREALGRNASNRCHLLCD